ncbi:hypothetical protein BGX28_008311 [Mortierella sp. GBA30]|nr:hypothetical protein BGX28_008311 [Mortierella sp. GBA30]
MELPPTSAISVIESTPTGGAGLSAGGMVSVNPIANALSPLSPTFATEDNDASLAGAEVGGSEFSCNICFDTSTGPVLTLCGHLFCWACLHQWLEAQRHNPTCPVCKAGCAQDKVIPIYGRGKEQVDPRSTTPKRPAGQRPEPLRNPAGFALATGQVTFSGTMIPPFMFSPFGIQYGASYNGNLGTNGAGTDYGVRNACD